MPKALLKGETSKVSVRFKPSVVFATAPDWQLTDWNDDVIQSGTAVNEGNGQWSAQITIPTTMIVPDGEQELSVNFYGVTTTGGSKEKSKEFSVIDLDEDWKSYGILWYTDDTVLRETVLFAQQPTSIKAEIKNGYGAGTVLFQQLITTPTPKSTNSAGYVYDIAISNVSLLPASGGWYPHQLFVTATFADGTKDVIVKPIYTLTALTLSHLTSLKRYLDKARLNEIDPNIGWIDEELIHYLYQGAMFINSIGEASYWTIDTMPGNLLTHLYKASEHEALNARYLAEGFTAFNFQAANSTLDVDRTQYIQTKMDELGNFLNEQLPKAKKAAIAANGPGVLPPGATGGRRALGALTIGLGPVTNVSTPFRRWPLRTW